MTRLLETGRRFRHKLTARLGRDTESLLLAVGRQMARSTPATVDAIERAEFRVFSQWGEDGVIQYLVDHVPIDRRLFVEFGVGDYQESNTRFLLQNNYWHGLVLDADTSHIDFLTGSGLLWRHSIDARSAFITQENINGLLEEAGISGDVGLLSVDVDGNDFWILQALTSISPRILIVEYNALFGDQAAITIPYDPQFVRMNAHYSNVYYGASLAAVNHLAVSRGYQLVGCESAGVNAFFVRSDIAGSLPNLSPTAAYRPRQHREARDKRGNLTYLSGWQAQLNLISDLPAVDVRTLTTGRIGDFVSAELNGASAVHSAPGLRLSP